MTTESTLTPIGEKSIPPYMPVEMGYGFKGILLHDSIEDKVQCHLCGNLYDALNNHIRTHGLSVKEYRVKFGFKSRTPLSGYKIREERAKRGYENWTMHLKGKFLSHFKKTKPPVKTVSIEEMNKYGTCPLQIDTRFDEVADKVGGTPTERELPVALFCAIVRRFGSYNQYLTKRNYVQNKRWNKYDKEELLNILREYKSKNGFLPVKRDFDSGRIPQFKNIYQYTKAFGGLAKAKELV